MKPLAIVLLAALAGCCARPLPHRPLHEIDIQGHQKITAADMCPDQYEERVPYTGEFLYCWGVKVDSDMASAN